MNTFLQMANAVKFCSYEFEENDYVANLLFLFKDISSAKFSRYYRSKFGYIAADGVKLRTSYDNCGYLLYSLKPYLFWCFKHDIYTKKECYKIARSFHVRKADVRLVLLMKLPIIQKRLSKLRRFKALTYDRLRSNIDDLPNKLNTFTLKFVRRKMKFITENAHNATDVFGIANDCISRGVQHVMLTYPKIYSKLHVMNLAKKAIHNYGINLIHYMTRDCRSVIENNEGVFSPKVVYYSANVAKAHSNSVDEDDTLSKVDSKLTCIKLMKKYHGRKQMALKLLMGIYDPDFTQWLNVNVRTQSHRIDNDELMVNLLYKDQIHKYKAYVIDFLKVEKSQFDAFTHQIGSMLTLD